MSWTPPGEILSVYRSGHGINMCSGQGVPAQMLLNGTVYLVCDPRVSTSSSVDLGLALGLGLGLGLPFLMIILCLFCCRATRYDNDTRWAWVEHLRGKQEPFVIGTTPLEAVEAVLSEGALADFRADLLSDRLKEEIMLHRCRAGRELREFVRYADQCHSTAVATWIDRLYPGEIPAAIRQKAATAPVGAARMTVLRPAVAPAEEV